MKTFMTFSQLKQDSPSVRRNEDFHDSPWRLSWLFHNLSKAQWRLSWLFHNSAATVRRNEYFFFSQSVPHLWHAKAQGSRKYTRDHQVTLRMDRLLLKPTQLRRSSRNYFEVEYPELCGPDPEPQTFGQRQPQNFWSQQPAFTQHVEIGRASCRERV